VTDIGIGHYSLMLWCGICDYGDSINGGALKTKYLRDENGIAFVLALMLLLVLTLIGISALNTSTDDIRISGNERAFVEAFYAAEAGIHEVLGRLWAKKADPTGVVKPIPDSDPLNPAWKLLLARDSGRGAARIGYVSGNQNCVASLQDQLDFGVVIEHKIDGSSSNFPDEVVQFNGDPIYVLKSYGFGTEGAMKVIEAEISPGFSVPGALYSEKEVDVFGNSTIINGMDQCGTMNKPGISITLPNPCSPPQCDAVGDPIQTTGGNPPTINGSPDREYNTRDLDLEGMIKYFVDNKLVDFAYDYSVNKTLTGYSDQWGIPTLSTAAPPGKGSEYPLSYTGEMNIVYFNMHGTKTIKLSGGSHGAGILLVDGNLEINGGFLWYGVIVVLGAVDYTGGGEKNVTGGVLTGENAIIPVDISGNAGILFCSEAVSKLYDKISNKGVNPFKVTKWREVFQMGN